MFKALFKCATCILIVVNSSVGLAQDRYPSKPVTIVVPFPAGGIVDFLGRLVAKHLSLSLGQKFIVVDRPGAGTNIGAGVVARSRPGGYTLLFGSRANTVNMTLYKRPGYDIVKNFTPVALVAFAPDLLLARPNLPVSSLSDVIELARSRRLTCAFAGYGSPSHIVLENFMRAAHISLKLVPYKGAPPAVLDVMAGRVDLFVSNIPATIGAIKSKKMKAIALASPTRSPALPDLPTFVEEGLKNYHWVPWYGLLAPAGTPPTVIKRLNEEVNRMLGTSEAIQRMTKNGTIPAPRSPAEFATLIRKDVAVDRELIETAGIRVLQ